MTDETQVPAASEETLAEASTEAPAEAPAEAVAEESTPVEAPEDPVAEETHLVDEPEDPVVLKPKSHPYEPRQIIEEGKRISNELLDEIEQRRVGGDIEVLIHALLNERAATDAAE